MEVGNTMKLIKENIEYEKMLGESSTNTVVKEEYIIPDTHPDVLEILMVDAKPTIVNSEVLENKIYLEGQIEFDVLYLGKTEEETEACGVSYSSKFTNYIELEGTSFKMVPEAQCNIEHMNCIFINERKISIEGVLELRTQVYDRSNIDIVRDIEGLSDVQFLKDSSYVDKVVNNLSVDLTANSHMQIQMDKPEIDSILKCDFNLHKKQIKLLEGKMQVEAFVQIAILYKGKASKELITLTDDVLITEEVELEGINSAMNVFGDYKIDGTEYNIKEDDLGEKRILDVEALINVDVKIIDTVNIEVIEDAYSPELSLNIEKEVYDIGLIVGSVSTESIVKENVELKEDKLKALEIVNSIGKVIVSEKRLLENKVVVDGIINVFIIYKTENEEKYLSAINEEIPFNTSIDIPGTKIDMNATIKPSIENLETAIEANTIAVKVLVLTNCTVSSNYKQAFLKDIIEVEGEKPKKSASVIIYLAEAGDTLWKIAKRYNTTVEAIEGINKLENPDKIMPGDKLIIPGRAVM